MQDKIYLSDLGDDDLISIQDEFYKSIKLKQVFEYLSESTKFYLGSILSQCRALDLGLSTFDKSNNRFSLPREFMEDGFNYKFIKLGFPGWQTGLFKLSVKPYISLDEIEEKTLMPHYDFGGISFGDEDMLSFKEDKFCTGKIVKDIFQKTFDDKKFCEACSSIFSQPIPELKDTKSFFNYGREMRFLKIETAEWQSANLRISFVLETKSDLDAEVQNNVAPSPLDEIRKMSEL